MNWLPVLLLFLITACSAPVVRPPVVDHGIKPLWVPKYHRVKKGDTLYSIAWQHGRDIAQIARWNNIKAPYTIYVNQKLLLQAGKTRVTIATASNKQASNKAVIKNKPAAKSKVTYIKPSNHALSNNKNTNKKRIKNNEFNHVGKIRWQWPVEGRLLRKFNKKTSGKKGIAIAGQSGTVIQAAAAGKVVYSGSGLVGYGRLIIIMHSKTYLSAYAHNSRLLVGEGDLIKAGQRIALMGNSGTQRTMLHFEIRRNGKPVDPLRYLPRR
ncbi:MAG: peptidoglycan DD-metalloendopeptidase family protein [Gammaproteobacteria bacterium]|nr:peptidoglycan DD-metalloendopeptidase family protein [Gammaproteobacteria bacterium]